MRAFEVTGHEGIFFLGDIEMRQCSEVPLCAWANGIIPYSEEH